MNKRNKKPLTAQEALARARKYCALSDRTREEVRRKLIVYGAVEGDIPAILEKLVNEGFVDEKRFAKSFAGGKFRMKKWGRNRIITAMKQRGLPAELIPAGLSELPATEYTQTLDGLLNKKYKMLQRSGKKREQRYSTLVRFAMGKGYEVQLVFERLKELKLEE